MDFADWSTPLSLPEMLDLKTFPYSRFSEGVTQWTKGT
jgi:hypothetical protein